MEQTTNRPDYIFEVSWEVCNKVGGIHTVITSKTPTQVNEWGNRLIMIGPDTWKGEGGHPEFTEDKELLPTLKSQATSKGLKIKIGRWKIMGNPIVILVDYTPFITKKDEIFSDLWVRYKVDSLTGGWDYIEPALFGYAAGKVIESFYHQHITFSDKIIAQFHEWITGVGLLYLNEQVPQIGTVFTTHATVVGRSIAGNGLPLYSKFDSYNADQEARIFNVTAKHSLEKMTAQNADCFTTVSDITARECERFLEKKPDIITPNGFDPSIVPDSFSFNEKRTNARSKLLKVASALFGYEMPADSMLILKSGRYEFRNKGIDLFIDALGDLNTAQDLKKEIIAFIFVPAHSTGPRKDLADFLNLKTNNSVEGNKVLTHNLQGMETDPIYNRIEQNHLNNKKDNKAKVVYVPVYLSGNDGIFNMSYYELLVGFDLSAFPSYYEPWGYTPLESLAFHVPTITTSLTGFGMIIQSKSANIDQGVSVIERNDNNDLSVVNNIASAIKSYTYKTTEEKKHAREAAYQLSKSALWINFIEYYKKAYNIALIKANYRAYRFTHEAKVKTIDASLERTSVKIDDPIWRKIFVQSQLPENLKLLDKLARNVWWTWNQEVIDLFEMIDSEKWKDVHFNPLVLLENLSLDQIKRLSKNEAFLLQLNLVNEKFENYLQRGKIASPITAYFCMEYGLCNNLKIYSGGLGILAGDYMKEASDAGMNMVGIGLLYRHGYFKQEITPHGEQIEREELHKFTSLPISPVYDKDGNWQKINIAFPGRTLYAKIWRVDIGIVPLYLMDTDIPENQPEDRIITDSLYGGDWENRLKQELLMGIGGIRLLRLLNINADVYHFNEGHAAFGALERILLLVQNENLSFEEAIEVVKSSTLFTTHTPVPAGHDTFSEELLRIYLSNHANLLNINWKRLMSLGKIDEENPDENFSISFFAARISQEINGVSAIHESVSRKMFGPLWKGYAKDELHIGHVTNGVHYQTWISEEWQSLFKNVCSDETGNKLWPKIAKVSDEIIWNTHLKHKNRLIEEIKNRLRNEAQGQISNVKEYKQQISNLTENALIITFARRLVTYKRPALLFFDQDKLASIIQNSKFPIIFLFAGKAHPRDYEGQERMREIIQISKQERFQGHVFFLQNYDMELAKYLTQGSDIWLNTPEIGMEASGTSGMKAAMNGVLNFSALDGWWAEAYNQDIGWAIASQNIGKNAAVQNEIEAEVLYRELEHAIIPLFSDRNDDELPTNWILKIKNSISQIGPVYTTQRILKEYTDNYYIKLNERSKMITANHFEQAKKLAAWKTKIMQEWNNISILSIDVFDAANKAFPLGSELNPTVIIDIGELSITDIGVEVLFINKRKDENDLDKVFFKCELTPIDSKNRQVTFSCKIPITKSGVFEHGFRIYPKNPLLPYRMDFPLLKWV